jgi:hypothetical protein
LWLSISVRLVLLLPLVPSRSCISTTCATSICAFSKVKQFVISYRSYKKWTLQCVKCRSIIWLFVKYHRT